VRGKHLDSESLVGIETQNKRMTYSSVNARTYTRKYSPLMCWRAMDVGQICSLRGSQEKITSGWARLLALRVTPIDE